MGAVLVTVTGPTSRMDLSLPTDARSERSSRRWWSAASLNRSPGAAGRSAGGRHTFRTRANARRAGVVDGSELQLRDMIANGDATGEPPDTGPAELPRTPTNGAGASPTWPSG